MRYLSVCSGIEAASVAWEPLGWEPAGFSEIEPFPSSVLSHHWPEVKNYGDFTTIARSAELLGELGEVDLLVGGTPCQSFSVAGLRGGLDDARGNLALEFFRLAQAVRPQWLVWENVPGVLSSGGGRDFGSILRALAELGYGFAYRVLDAQYFGVPQRRKRVFLVGHIGGRAERAAAVLFEPQGVRGNPAEGKYQGKEVARAAREGARNRSWESNGVMFAPQTVGTLSDGAHMGGGSTDRTPTRGVCCPSISNTLTSRMHKGINTTVDEGQTPIITTGGGFDDKSTLAFQWQLGGTQQMSVDVDVSPPLLRKQTPAVSGSQVRVRRLTPTECERLQGFPDGHTNVPHRGKPAADGPRYKALGNSMAVPVMHWIGRRIALLERVVPWNGQAADSPTVPKEVSTRDGIQYAFSWA